MSTLSAFDRAQLAALEPGWAALDDPALAALDEELRGEVAPGHPLYGADVILLARRTGHGDLLGYLPRALTPWVRVTLSGVYARHGVPETPPWPGTQFYETLDDFVRAL